MIRRALDRLEDLMAPVGDAWHWYLVGLAIPAAVAAWWIAR